ncbi:hypothetical protein SAMN04489841_3432 [Natrinema salaciae]|uniref:Uncharacterized protein n=2 Tax=Natrinema salaciae TaxID=1186196 RepID=A0A1H9MQ34_9EURY|nr:hypothetical protein SAMN04489841_3432 [Natrinema salaciae]
MKRSTSVFLAVLLVFSLPTTTGIAANPSGGIDGESDAIQQRQFQPQVTAPTELENTTNRLTVTGDVRNGYSKYKPDLAVELASGDDELRIDHDQYAIVDSKFESATTEEQREMIRAAYDRLQNRTDALEQRERKAVRAHAAGELSSEALLQTLLRNHNAAGELSESLRQLEAQAKGVPGALSSTRADYKTFDYHRTPLRASLERMAANPDNDYHNVVVTTSQNGYNISVMDGNRYILETARFDNRDTTQVDQFEEGEAYDYSKELYPWASDRPYFQDNSPDHYWAEMDHEQGRLEFYFDSGTGDVYREVQEISAPSLPSTELGPWNGDGLNMTMNRTPTNGPVKVTITDQETGEPVSATVTYDGFEVGETGEDGTLWVVPMLGTNVLEAKTETGVVNGTVTR